MASPFTTSDANVPFKQDQDAISLSSHVPEMHTTTIVTSQKHLLYVEDYDSLPPSYSVAQQQGQQMEQRGSERMLADVYDNGSSNETSELETAPLMAAEEAEDDDYRYPPTAPTIDQMEFGLPPDVNNSRKHTTRTKHYKVYRLYLAFTIFAIGITLMSAILATIDCYNSCKERDDCDKCPRTRREGFTAFFYITFILSSIAVIGKVVLRLLY
ncbi:hypothetical protein MAM1_0028d02242 [Mucor ambiguus]|uniref:Uncharacterized protein n=1 Tax=Mucor ambiguus TaxID=91626 RepID=A0A0C9LSI1_9FUNG|nr:hypothetical protein MAM1_0028d02242 [Mucor ambiguus]